jgi:hypothetical protein
MLSIDTKQKPLKNAQIPGVPDDYEGLVILTDWRQEFCKLHKQFQLHQNLPGFASHSLRH